MLPCSCCRTSVSSLKDPDRSKEVAHAAGATPATATAAEDASSGNDSFDKSQNDKVPIPKLEINRGCGDSGSSVEDEVSII